jgi:hypothetical protein
VNEESVWAGSRRAVIDSFFRRINLPRPEFDKFAAEMTKKSYVQCDGEKGTCLFLGACKAKILEFDPLWIQFSDKFEYSIQPQDYLFDGKFSDGTVYCGFDIQRTDQSYYTIGQIFLFNYYTVYDFEDNSVGLYLHTFSNSMVQVTKEQDRPPLVNNPPEDTKFPAWALILILVVIVGALLAGGVVYFLRRRKARLAHNLHEYNQLEGTNGNGRNINKGLSKTLE